MDELRLIGRILTPHRDLPRGLLVARDGRIVDVSPWPGPPPPGSHSVEGWIVPGLVDLQVNGLAGQDFADPSADLGLASRRLAQHGVTAFLPTLTSGPFELTRRRLAALSLRWPAARSLGVHLEGPYLNPSYGGAHEARWIRPPDLAEAQQLLAAGPVRLVTLAPEQPRALDLIRFLIARGVVVSLGHSGADYDQARLAIQSGARAGTHLFNAMPPLHHRQPGLAGALLDDEQVIASLIADGVHLHPATLRLALAAKGADRLALISDAIAAADMPPGSFRLAGQFVRADASAARRADGALAGAILPLDAAVRNMVALSGCSLAQAITMATATPARLLGLGHKGRLQRGADADIVVLSPDLTVRRTYVAGQLVAQTSGGEPAGTGSRAWQP